MLGIEIKSLTLTRSCMYYTSKSLEDGTHPNIHNRQQPAKPHQTPRTNPPSNKSSSATAHTNYLDYNHSHSFSTLKRKYATLVSDITSPNRKHSPGKRPVPDPDLRATTIPDANRREEQASLVDRHRRHHIHYHSREGHTRKAHPCSFTPCPVIPVNDEANAATAVHAACAAQKYRYKCHLPPTYKSSFA
ncbi:hypothetical protein BO86DRAFT_458365 [Aspergillus japonicus CBS 114.51]|uniref:Uncharacterized protein n=1 Tax=Aspergillus japonicus CBS 114.51 TaxID=1448312 RepID=A0A8T8WT65_ASPJA|nr:hypothetical protein BO86DRAFT_458365 [Aspergillus japonicus CBS 114.51]RAH78529.1 hypothetical protein BO86DRAFT_458365 [Aspergillus japonicus CBS 114.51]